MASLKIDWIKETFKPDVSILDASETEGAFPVFLGEYKNIDLVAREEIECIIYRDFYRNTFHKDINEFYYDYHDVVIFGHIDEKKSEAVIEYAKSHSGCVLKINDNGVLEVIYFPLREQVEQPVKKPATRKRTKKDQG